MPGYTTVTAFPVSVAMTRMDRTRMIYFFGLLLAVSGSVSGANKCEDGLPTCLKSLVGLNPIDFNVGDEEQLKEVCKAKREAAECAINYINNCTDPGRRVLFEASIGGNLKLTEDMCTDGSKINKGFLQNRDCFRFGKLENDIKFCNDKLKESQTAVSKANMEERLKLFYGCCAFEWHRNCLTRSARAKCNNEAANFVYHVATVLGGNVRDQLCSSAYSSCYGLHGVDPVDIDEQLNMSKGVGMMSASLLAAICLALLYILS